MAILETDKATSRQAFRERRQTPPSGGSTSQSGSNSSSATTPASSNSSAATAPASSTRVEAGNGSSSSTAELGDEYALEDVDFSAPPQEPEVLDIEDEENVYQGEYNGTSVEVTEWDGADGSQNDHLEGVLLGQGFTLEEIYAASPEGSTLIDEVAQANSLQDPNLVEAGQVLYVPTTQAPSLNTEQLVANGDRVESTGTPGDDDLLAEGSDQDDAIVLSGAHGSDYLAAASGSGNDRLFIEAGADQDFVELDGGEGHDFFQVRLQDGASEAGPDEAYIVGGEGYDVLNLSGDGQGNVVFEDGVNRIEFEDGTIVNLDGVEELNLNGQNGEVQSFTLAEDGSYVDVDAQLEPPAEPELPPEQQRRQELTTALDVIEQNLDYLGNPSNADDVHDARVSVDDLVTLADEDSWRPDYVDSLTSSGLSGDEANERADALAEAAATLLDNPTLVNVIDGGAYEGGEDGFFGREDLAVARAALSDEAQQHYQTIVDFRPAFQAATPNQSDANVENPHPVFDSDLEAVLEIGEALLGGGSLEDLLDDERLGAIATGIVSNLPPDIDASEAILQMAEAADFLLHQEVNAQLDRPLTQLELAAAVADYDALANLDAA